MPPTPAANQVACPEPEGPTRFTCDGCLEEHLRTVHGTSYAEVYGDVSPAWLAFCPGHRHLPVDRLMTARA